jgi:catechol 2,3-dioxygenase-like lactoylglutathione lyase family enzyme
MAAVQGYHHVSLSVSDLAKSAEWYRRALGFEIDAEIEGTLFAALACGRRVAV